MTKSIGIDLGTTNSVAGIKKVHTEIIKNQENDFLTPSCVALKQPQKRLFRAAKQPEPVVGKHALEWMKQDPENTITGIKRLMGRRFHNTEVQKMINEKRNQYKITKYSRGTENSLAVVLNDSEYTPEQISSMILKKIKKDSENYLKDTVEYAVITVPAYFNDKQKHATRTAASLCGLKVKRLLPEPTAAAISFGVDEVGEDDAKTIIVFDFGGGTFDLSVLTISGGQFIEQGKGGNMWLGGEDIDREIFEYVLAETARENDIENIHQLIDSQEHHVKTRFTGELKLAVEQAKIRLSEQDEVYIEILGLLKDSEGDLIDVDVELTVDRFNEIIRPMVEKIIELIKNLLSDIHFTPDLIDHVLLVGGSSKIPLIRKALQEEFGKDKIMLHERPMLAVAEGAAILSHRLADQYDCPGCGKVVLQSDDTCGKCGFDLVAHTIDEGLLDIVHSTAHDYFICLENNKKQLLIEKNTPLPCECTERFSLVHKDQKLVHMKFQNIVNEKEEDIGDLWMGIDAEPDTDLKEAMNVEVTLKIDENNIADVGVSMEELPDVKLSKTLSRGKADEKLFLALEKMINTVNEKKYGEYVIIDMTNRSVQMINTIHKVIDKKTGAIIEDEYQHAHNNIEKSIKMAENDITTMPLIYYARSAINDYPVLMSKSQKKNIETLIENMKKSDTVGTYEEIISLHDELNTELNDVPFLNILKLIDKAGDLCGEYEPAKVSYFDGKKFDLIDAIGKHDSGKINSLVEQAVPAANEIIDKYDNRAGEIYKGITR